MMQDELDAIRENAEAAHKHAACSCAFHTDYQHDVPALMAYIEQLEAREAAMREIVQAVAKYRDEYDSSDYSDGNDEWLCQFCGAATPIYGHPEGVTHKLDCPVTRARALLADGKAGE